MFQKCEKSGMFRWKEKEVSLFLSSLNLKEMTDAMFNALSILKNGEWSRKDFERRFTDENGFLKLSSKKDMLLLGQILQWEYPQSFEKGPASISGFSSGKINARHQTIATRNKWFLKNESLPEEVNPRYAEKKYSELDVLKRVGHALALIKAQADVPQHEISSIDPDASLPCLVEYCAKFECLVLLGRAAGTIYSLDVECSLSLSVSLSLSLSLALSLSLSPSFPACLPACVPASVPQCLTPCVYPSGVDV